MMRIFYWILMFCAAPALLFLTAGLLGLRRA